MLPSPYSRESVWGSKRLLIQCYIEPDRFFPFTATTTEVQFFILEQWHHHHAPLHTEPVLWGTEQYRSSTGLHSWWRSRSLIRVPSCTNTLTFTEPTQRPSCLPPAGPALKQYPADNVQDDAGISVWRFTGRRFTEYPRFDLIHCSGSASTSTSRLRAPISEDTARNTAPGLYYCFSSANVVKLLSAVASSTTFAYGWPILSSATTS